MLISEELLKTLPIGQIIKNDLESKKNYPDIGKYGVILYNHKPNLKCKLEYSTYKNRVHDCYERSSTNGECLDIDGIATVRAYESKVEDNYFWRKPFKTVQVPIKNGILQMNQFEKGQFILIKDIDTDGITKKVKTKFSNDFELEL